MSCIYSLHISENYYNFEILIRNIGIYFYINFFGHAELMDHSVLVAQKYFYKKLHYINI